MTGAEGGVRVDVEISILIAVDLYLRYYARRKSKKVFENKMALFEEARLPKFCTINR